MQVPSGMYPEWHVALPHGWHLTIGSHALVSLLAVLAASRFVARRAPETGLAWLVPVAAVVVLAGARVLFWALSGGPLVGAGGLASMGGVLSGLALAPLLARLAAVPVAVLLDTLVPAGLLALGIGRIGCWFAGCCYGTPTPLPWGVVFPELGPAPRHPLQLYAAAVDLAIVYAVVGRPLPAGAVAGRALAAFAAARFALEALRDRGASDFLDPIGLTLAQVLCLVLFVAARLALRHSIGGLSHPPARGSVRASMKAALGVVMALGLAAPAVAIDAAYDGTLAVRPARGTLDVATGFGGLRVRRWRLVPAAGSDGIDPAAEAITLSLGADEVTLPAGALVTSGKRRRFVFRDDTVVRGVTRLELRRRAAGDWLVSFRARGLDFTRLAAQYPLCEAFAFAIGNDEGASGIDLDRPGGADSTRIRVRGFCEVDDCPEGAADVWGAAIRPRHVVCPH
jgi:phosphatidylglycerol:prolipoprotein diacylglycerol transferase